MRPEYALARTAPETGKYEARLPGGVSVNWEDADAAFALAGSPTWCRDLVLCKWAGAPYTLSIAIGAGKIAFQECKAGSWGIVVAHAAAKEVIAATQCGRCDGRGIIRPESSELVEDCPSCEGTGATKWTNEDRAELIGVTLNEFRRGCYKFHKECLRVLIQGELETLSAMAYRLNRG